MTPARPVRWCLLIALLAVPVRAATLKDAFTGAFRVGAALNAAQFSGEAPETALAVQQFNTISPENALKWGPVHPSPGRFRFDGADRYVAFGEAHGMWIVGHTLVWHRQTPAWVFESSPGHPADREALLARLRDHIHTVVGRYRGRIRGWDVVNEALAEDGSLRQTPWLAIIGEDYISKAFEFAHEADPAAELYYNDYNLEYPEKRAGALRLLAHLKAQGVPVRAVGLQGHVRLATPTAAAVGDTIDAFAALGLRVNVSELDVDVLPPAHEGDAARPGLDPYPGGPPPEVQRALTARYAALFATFVAHRAALDRVTFWGVTDAASWLNGWPVPGRTNHPLLFDRSGRPKPAFDAVLHTAPR